MAVASSSTPVSKKKARVTKSVSSKKPKLQEETDVGVNKPPAPKRTKSPGVRLVHGRLYDSENGKTCHQCRQKTMDFVASCKKQINGKTCTINFCHKCLLNRYGEKAEEMAVLEDWNCPKCRGMCNCSFCMKKKGHQPTGILVHTAKGGGFSSVSELLHVQGPEHVANNKVTKNVGKKTIKTSASKTETIVASPTKRGKENDLTRNIDQTVQPLPLQSSPNVKRAKKMKREALKDVEESNHDVQVNLKVDILPRTSPRKLKVSGVEDHGAKGVSNKVSSLNPNTGNGVSSTVNGCKNNIDKKLIILHQVAAKLQGDQSVNDVTLVDSFGGHTKKIKIENKHVEPEITLPEGRELTSLVGLSIPPEDIGHALQFLEFCSAFKEILDLKKGEAGSILRELIRGGRTRGGKYSPVVRMFVQLLSLIQEDIGEESLSIDALTSEKSWMKALHNCATRSKPVLEKLKLEGLCKTANYYYSLDSSKKLRVLTFLCDEVLCTGKIRGWMDDKQLENVEKRKEAKEKVTAARHKEKEVKQKMQDEVAKAIIAKNGSSLSIAEHEAIVSKIKIEAAKAHAEFIQSTEMLPDVKQVSDAVRAEPILRNEKGHIYWKFEGYTDESSVVMQDVGSGGAVESGEKWFTFNVEQEKEIENYISSSRKRKRLQTVKC